MKTVAAAGFQVPTPHTQNGESTLLGNIDGRNSQALKGFFQWFRLRCHWKYYPFQDERKQPVPQKPFAPTSYNNFSKSPRVFNPNILTVSGEVISLQPQPLRSRKSQVQGEDPKWPVQLGTCISGAKINPPVALGLCTSPHLSEVLEKNGLLHVLPNAVNAPDRYPKIHKYDCMLSKYVYVYIYVYTVCCVYCKYK